ncbi:MAG TPA: S9 family peptidase [Gemmatimonadaceae bacterium]|nr:S9 family peptidase [Gemmatimonadaceae bacterium]
MRRLLVSLCVFTAVAASAQAPAKKNITLRETIGRPTYGGYQLSPDGKLALFTRTERDPKDYTPTSHIWLHDFGTGRSFQLTSSARGESNPRFLPDGRVAFTSNRDTRNAWYVISPNGGEAVKLVDGGDSLPTGGSFSKDGKRLTFTEQTQRADRKEWEERVKRKDDGYYAEQKLTYTHIWVYDLETKKKRQLTTGTTDNMGPAFSPDASMIAFSSNRSGKTVRDANHSNNSDLFLVPTAGGEPRQITTNPGPDNNPVWSPDGQMIAYSSSDRVNSSADQMDVKVMPAAGGQPRNLTADLDYSVSNIEWSKDGKWIYFTATEGLTSKLYKVPASGGKPTPISFGNGYVVSDFVTTDDGSKWIVTGATLEEPGVVYLTGPDGAQAKRVFEDHGRLSSEFNIARSETLTWKGADNWDIEGILTYPVNYQPGQKYPLILQIHGGPFGRYAATFNPGAQIWAARGYAVLQGNPRGSSGRTYAFGAANQNDWGGKDFIDIMNGVDHVVKMGVADTGRLAVMGGSYGGFMTFWTITQTPRFKAAIGHAGISDWYSFFGQTDIPNLLEYGFGGLPTQSKATYERWSPIEHATKVTTPLLITHGENDQRVPIPQADQYYRTLKKLGKTVEFLRYPREGHGITEPMHRLHLDEEQAKWFDKYVLRGTTRVVP